MAYTRNTIFYKELQLKNRTWKLQFIPADSVNLASPAEVELPDFALNTEGFTINGGYENNLTIGCPASAELSININPRAFTGDFSDVLNWMFQGGFLTSSSISLIDYNNFSFYSNVWLLRDEDNEVVFEGFQASTASGEKYNIGSKVSTAEIKVFDAFKGVLADTKLTYNKFDVSNIYAKNYFAGASGSPELLAQFSAQDYITITDNTNYGVFFINRADFIDEKKSGDPNYYEEELYKDTQWGLITWRNFWSDVATFVEFVYSKKRRRAATTPLPWQSFLNHWTFWKTNPDSGFDGSRDNLGDVLTWDTIKLPFFNLGVETVTGGLYAANPGDVFEIYGDIFNGGIFDGIDNVYDLYNYMGQTFLKRVFLDKVSRGYNFRISDIIQEEYRDVLEVDPDNTVKGSFELYRGADSFVAAIQHTNNRVLETYTDRPKVTILKQDTYEVDSLIDNARDYINLDGTKEKRVRRSSPAGSEYYAAQIKCFNDRMHHFGYIQNVGDLYFHEIDYHCFMYAANYVQYSGCGYTGLGSGNKRPYPEIMDNGISAAEYNNLTQYFDTQSRTPGILQVWGTVLNAVFGVYADAFTAIVQYKPDTGIMAGQSLIGREITLDISNFDNSLSTLVTSPKGIIGSIQDYDIENDIYTLEIIITDGAA